MTDWTPDVAVISLEHQTILDLIRLYKREMAYHQSVILALQLLANSGHAALANQFVDQIKALSEATPPTDEDVPFRPVESALMDGRDYLPSLQSVLSKYL